MSEGAGTQDRGPRRFSSQPARHRTRRYSTPPRPGLRAHTRRASRARRAARDERDHGMSKLATTAASRGSPTTPVAIVTARGRRGRSGWLTAANPRRLGARIGGLAVLHTWGQSLTHHPHVHCAVPGGGLSLDGTRTAAAPKRSHRAVLCSSMKKRSRRTRPRRRTLWTKTPSTPSASAQIAAELCGSSNEFFLRATPCSHAAVSMRHVMRGLG